RTKAGTVVLTDGNGQFRIKAEKNSLLTITFSGFQAVEVKAVAGRGLQISLQTSISKLNEVVVIGYGTQLKEKLTGSVATLGAADIQKTAGASFTEAMIGKMPGVQVSTVTGEPGAAPSIRVRGT